MNNATKKNEIVNGNDFKLFILMIFKFRLQKVYINGNKTKKYASLNATKLFTKKCK